MEVKQSKVAAFFIDNDDVELTLAYIEKNAPLLKSYLLVFSHAIDAKIKERCDTWELLYVHNNGQLKGKTAKDKIEPPKLVTQEITPDSAEQRVEKKEIYRTIRSGESVTYHGDLIISGNINDGATISSEGTLAIFGIISGDISCNGSYLILSECHRGKVVFQGEVINEMIQGKQLKIFYKEANEIKTKELT